MAIAEEEITTRTEKRSEEKFLPSGTELWSAEYGKDEANLLGVVPEGPPWVGHIPEGFGFKVNDRNHASTYMKLECEDPNFKNRGIYVHYERDPKDPNKWHFVRQKTHPQEQLDPERNKKGMASVMQTLIKAGK